MRQCRRLNEWGLIYFREWIRLNRAPLCYRFEDKGLFDRTLELIRTREGLHYPWRALTVEDL